MLAPEKVDSREHLEKQPGGTPVDWANESHLQATHIMKPNPAAIDEAYYKANIELVDQKLALAGLRLAAVLNNALGQSACSKLKTRLTATLEGIDQCENPTVQDRTVYCNRLSKCLALMVVLVAIRRQHQRRSAAAPPQQLPTGMSITPGGARITYCYRSILICRNAGVHRGPSHLHGPQP